MTKINQHESMRHAQLLSLFHSFGEIGKSVDGGVSRLAASKEDQQVRDYLCSWLHDNDFLVSVDPIGNIFGTLDFGKEYPPKYFFSGSHLDSQPNGGRFDGVLGVVCACMAGLYLKELVEAKALDPDYRFFVVANWTGEEGARFQPSLIGSSVFCGALALEDALNLTDTDGVDLGEALHQIGYLGMDIMPFPDRYLEIHIEQDEHLEQSGQRIGLVGAPRKYAFTSRVALITQAQRP